MTDVQAPDDPAGVRDDEPVRFEAEGPWPLPAADAEGFIETDGAVIALQLAAAQPDAVAGVLFFGCNVDASGTKEFVFTKVVERCFHRHQRDYAALSATPDRFEALVEAVNAMQRSQPNLTSTDLAAIDVPVTVVHAEHDEFIREDHAVYLAESLPNTELVRLDDVSHFAPVQRPDVFDGVIAGFLARVGD